MASKKAQLIIEHIIYRFLDPKMDYKSDDFKAIADILDLPIYALKSVGRDVAKTYLDVFHVSTIREIGSLDPEHPFNILIPPQRDQNIEHHLAYVESVINAAREKVGDLEKLKSTILISKMIANAWNKRKDYIGKKDTKVITVGLDNAGKTAILTALGGRLGLGQLAKLEPTKRVERRKIETNNLELFLWDFGGQAEYRKNYLASPEKYFLRTDLLIYVVDMQDPDRYKESFTYFKEILQILQRLSESPYILCFLHKSDPDIINDPDFQVNLEYVIGQMKDFLHPYTFEYDIYVTSIFNFFTSEPKFSRFIKDVLKDHQSLSDPMLEKVSSLGKIIETTLNAVITLSSSIGSQLVVLDNRIEEMERKINFDLPKTPKERLKESYQPGAPSSTPMGDLRQIEQMAIASRRNLGDLRLHPGVAPLSTNPPAPGTSGNVTPSGLTPPPDVHVEERDKIELTRQNVLNDLQSIIKKMKTLKD